MNLWLLRPVNYEGDRDLWDDDPWDPGYDSAFGFVVRADTEQRAREIAEENAGDELKKDWMDDQYTAVKQPWSDSQFSTCIELQIEGPEELIIRDFHAA